MPVVDLGPADRAPALPRRFALSTAEFQELITGTPPGPDGLVEPSGRPVPEVASALAGIGIADLVVRVEVRQHDPDRHRTRSVTVHHHLHRHGVTAVARSGDRVELGWFDHSRWPGELTRVAAVPDAPTIGDDRPLAVPWELFVAVGAALRADRQDLVPVLIARAGCDGSWVPTLHPGDLAARLIALHRDRTGLLRAAVLGRERAGCRRAAGPLTWLLDRHGWRSLRPQPGRTPMLHLTPVAATRLSGELAPLIARVRP